METKTPESGESMFVAMTLSRHVDISVGGQTHEVPLIFADGMVGALPVFTARADAERFAAGVCEIVDICLNTEAE